MSEKAKEPAKESQTPSKESSKERKGSSSSAQSSFPALPSTTTDSVRLKCREMLCAAIKGDGVAVDGTDSLPNTIYHSLMFVALQVEVILNILHKCWKSAFSRSLRIQTWSIKIGLEVVCLTWRTPETLTCVSISSAAKLALPVWLTCLQKWVAISCLMNLY